MAARNVYPRSRVIEGYWGLLRVWRSLRPHCSRGRRLAEMYRIPAIVLDDLIEVKQLMGSAESSESAV